MVENEPNSKRHLNVSFGNDSKCAVNSLIIDYYQKFGKKRDLEQFFSLSTAESDIRDPASSFWRKMKAHGDTSDSGDGKTETPPELCKISIICTLPEFSTSQDEYFNSKDDSESPIITEEPVLPHQAEQDLLGNTDNESQKYDENNSQKSTDVHLDESANRQFSPTSSLNSQRKLEWDSLGDVGYGNESERKASGSSLSTLERLALHQQYSINDTKDNQYGAPNSHSTPVDENLNIGKKSHIRKTLKIHKKDIDIVKLNMPHNSEINSGAINVNLSKHISFNVDKDGEITIPKENSKYFPNKVSVETEITPQIGIDKEIQTSLAHNKTQTTPTVKKGYKNVCEQKFPILISLNTLKKRARRKKFRNLKKRTSNKVKKKINSSKILPEKSGTQISEAESFEYMPGYIFSQNQVKSNNGNESNSVGNKSSLESSIPITTDSSKATVNSFTIDLEKSINLLKRALHPKYDNSKLKQKLIKEVVQRLLSTKYKDDNSASSFLSDLSFKNKRTEITDDVPTTTSNSDGNNIEKNDMIKRPKKSILRMDKFNPSEMASTSQSTPNLHTLVQNENPVNTLKTSVFSNTESDYSSRERNSSDTITKLSSEELYKKYLEALKREKVHKQALKDKEALLKSKLVSSDSCLKKASESTEKTKERLYKLIKELARNNVDDGSGDANKLAKGSSMIKSKFDYLEKQRSHSVFTLTSGKLGCNTKLATNKTCHNIRQNTEACCSHSNDDCCSNYPSSSKLETVKCLIQENRNRGEENKFQINCKLECNKDPKNNLALSKHHCHSNKSSPRCVENVVIDNIPDVQYVCLCPSDEIVPQEVPDKLLIYKCTGLGKQGICLANTISKESISIGVQCSSDCVCGKQLQNIKLPSEVSNKKMCVNTDLECGQSSSSVIYPARKASTSSQTNNNLDLILGQTSCTRSAKSISPRDRNKPGILVNRGDTEVIQSIQTEITIDPKISDPTLSDVKFVDDLGCQQFSNEQNTFKNISSNKSYKTVFEETAMKQQSKCNDPQINNGNFSNDLRSSNRLAQSQGTENMSNFRDSKSHKDKYSIPIQGTNMTLVVSLGSNMEDGTKLTKNIDMTKKGVLNKPNLCLDQNTLSEGFTKGVQCTSTDIFTQINKDHQQYESNGNTKLRNTCNNDDSFTQINKDHQQYVSDGNTKLRNTCNNDDNFTQINKDLQQYVSDGNTKLRNTCNNDDNFTQINKDHQQYVRDGNTKLRNTCNNDGNFTQINKDHQQYVHDGNTKLRNTCNNDDNFTQINKDHQQYVSNGNTKLRNTCNNDDIFTQINSDRREYIRDGNTRLIYSCDNDKISANVSRTPNAHTNEDCSKYNTYPKKTQIAKKPFVRSNTDTDYLESMCSNINKNAKIYIETRKDCCSDVLTKPKNIGYNKNECKPLKIMSEKVDTRNFQYNPQQSSMECRSGIEDNVTNDPLMNIIQDITKRYTKKDIESSSRKKCFKEIITVLNYLLDTEDSSDERKCSAPPTSKSDVSIHDNVCNSNRFQESNKEFSRKCCGEHTTKKTFVDRGVQLSKNKKQRICTESSDFPTSSELPTTSTDTNTCRVLNKIRKECERYHQKKCKSGHKRCDESTTTTTVNCERCNRKHQCSCRSKCKLHKTKPSLDKGKKKCVAYNLIIQTSDSLVSEEAVECCRPLQNVVVKVPPKTKKLCNAPFKEVAAKIEKKLPPCSPQRGKAFRCRSLPNDSEMSSEELGKKMRTCTVRDYLEMNRPDFVEKSTQRQSCMKFINQTRTNERANKRKLLSQQLDRQQTLNSLNNAEIQQLARELSAQLRRKKVESKFISEYEMKKHSEKIYKSLPEVMKKKEELKKENLKKTNLLMANIFKKNLQKKTLGGSVNLSNYSTVLKI